MTAAERKGPGEGPRLELQLDTAQILLVVAGLVALCASSFILGQWTERDKWKDAAVRGSPVSKKLTETDAGADLTFFDTLGAKGAEPARQASPPSHSSASPPHPPAPSPASAAAGGPAGDVPSSPAGSPGGAAPAGREAAAKPPSAAGFALQVFAGDRAQAERLIGSLSRKGYAARLLPGAKGPGTARIRVYGFATRSDAERGAERLKKDEKLSPWVVKAD